MTEALVALGAVLLVVTFGHLLKEPLYEFHTHVIPRLALLLFVLMVPREADRFSLDRWLSRKSEPLTADPMRRVFPDRVRSRPRARGRSRRTRSTSRSAPPRPWRRPPRRTDRPDPRRRRLRLPSKEPKPLEVQPDGSSVDTIVAALYAAVSHGPDSEPNWKRLRALFLPGAIVVPPKRPGAETVSALDAAGFEDRIRRSIAGRRERGERLGFTEREIARRENRFGAVCQVFSTYETLWSPHERPPFSRGVHSIQLVSDGRRWWIAVPRLGRRAAGPARSPRSFSRR